MRVISVDHIRNNIQRLAESVLGNEMIISEQNFQSSYRKSISKLRGFAAPEKGIKISFNESFITQLAIEHGVFSELSKEGFREQDIKSTEELYYEAIELIKNTSPELYQLIELMVTDVLFVTSSRVGGGTGSHLPGLLCVSPDKAWEPIDLAECLIHETTHLSTFLCDMLFGLYTEPVDQLERDECRVLSAVRIGEFRPLDKALHSGLVAVPLLYFQNLLGIKTLAIEFSESVNECANGLLEKQRFFTEYGRLVVKDYSHFTKTLDYKYVEESLNWSDEFCLKKLDSVEH